MGKSERPGCVRSIRSITNDRIFGCFSQRGSSLAFKAFLPAPSHNGTSNRVEPQEDCAWALLVQRVESEILRQLAAKFGGTRLYIPRMARENSELARSLGAKAACQITALFGGERIYVPHDWESSIKKLNWKSEVPRLRAKHFSVARIARTLGCSERHVYKIMASANGSSHPR